MNILITNDDGISSNGIIALEKVLSEKHETYLIAPLRERSATSMAITIFDSMRVEKINDRHFIVDGYPVDCVNIGLHGNIFPKIDLVISGINRGVNMGHDVHYSGTVGAARHAAVHNYPALAVSSGKREAGADYTSEAKLVLQIIEDSFHKLKRGIIYNINFPMSLKPYPDSIRITTLGVRTYLDTYEKKPIYENIADYFLGGSELGQRVTSGSDFEAYELGNISITPILLNTTDFSEIQRAKEEDLWKS